MTLVEMAADTATLLAPVFSTDDVSPSVDSDELLRQIIDEHSPSMFRVARSIVHDSALAEDVVQESIVKAWRGLAGYRAESSLRSWLLRITHNTAISMLRKRREDVRDPSVMPEASNGIDYASPERRVDGRMMVDQLWVALDQLDPISRTIVVLREIESMSYEDIVETMQLPLPTIKTRLFRARKQLASALTEWT
jgi:RNA polymerase sigma-70 factor, ECF subfamily